MADVGADEGTQSVALPNATVELISLDAGVATLKISGQLDVSTEHVVREALEQATNDGANELLLDVSALEFMDSSGLAVLLIAARRAPVELRNPPEIIRRLITIAGLANTLPMTPDA